MSVLRGVRIELGCGEPLLHSRLAEKAYVMERNHTNRHIEFDEHVGT